MVQNGYLVLQYYYKDWVLLDEQNESNACGGSIDFTIPNVTGKTFLLVDDICTTGATLTEAAQTLYRAGARKVEAFTLSKRL